MQEEHTRNGTSYMRPNVLEQMQKNQIREPSRETQPHVRAGSGKSRGRRGPKNRPTYQPWQYATWRARMRVWCNNMKGILLQQEHDPAQPQTYRVIQATASPVD